MMLGLLVNSPFVNQFLTDAFQEHCYSEGLCLSCILQTVAGSHVQTTHQDEQGTAAS